jgi:WD40 repeat protein
MAKKKHHQEQLTSATKRTEFGPGVKSLSTLEGHNSRVWCVAFDAQGLLLARGSEDRTVKLWQVHSG